MKKEKILFLVIFQCMVISYVEYALIDTPIEQYLSHIVRSWFGAAKSTKSVVPKLVINVLRSYEHLSKSLRFSRNKDRRGSFENLLRTLKAGLLSIDTKLKKYNETQLFCKINSSTTLLMNAVNELSIKQVNLQLTALMKSTFRTMQVVIAYSDSGNGIPWIKIREYQYNIKWIKLNPNSSPVKILYEMVKHSKTRFVICTRNSVITDNDISIQKMIEPILNNHADIVGLPVLDAQNKNLWRSGCYQIKVLRYQLRMMKGYDSSVGSLATCSYIRGPFALQKAELQNVLTRRLYFGKEMLDHFMFYLDLFHEIINGDNKHGYKKVLVVCQNCPSAIERNSNISLKNRDFIQFLSKHKLSKIILANGTSIEYDCSDVGTQCSSYDKFGGKNRMFRPLCCIKELHDLLLKTSEILDTLHVDYELDSGTSLGATKLMDTLPWERDHDLDIRTANISKVTRNQVPFQTAGYKIYTENNGTYVGVKSPNWRLEMFGMDALMRDYVSLKNNSNLSYRNAFLPKSRFCLNTTLIQMGNRWLPSHPSPGLFSREHLGRDVLKHAWHWIDTGMESSHQPYRAGSWWGECKIPGHHSCSDNYLPDGNLQFKSFWV